jgi:archaemetzincin
MLKIEPGGDASSSKGVTRSSIRYIMTRERWNGFAWMKIRKLFITKWSFLLLLFLLLLFLLFLTQVSAEERIHKMGIVLVPVGKVDGKVLEGLTDDLHRIFGRKVSIGKGMPQPDDAYNKKRNQYLSTVLLKTLMEEKEYMAYQKVLGIVDQDLYVPELNFVFGEAGRRAAVISLTRLRQEFYHLPEDRPLFRQRVLTEAVHELGHTYRLGHCPNPRCVMFFSNSLTDTDRKGSTFCQECKRKLNDIMSKE